jgi:O-antigen/teichoic acid export membrane protein
MLVGQTAINFAANVISAAFGLINVVVFTRLFAPAEFGTYVLGLGFGTIASTFMTTWCGFPSCGSRRAATAPTSAASSCRGC